MLSYKHLLLVCSIATCSMFTACKQETVKDTDKEHVDSLEALNGGPIDTAVAINMNSPNADESILLRLNPEKGATYTIETSASFFSDESMDTFRMRGNSTKWVKSTLLVKSNDADKVIFEYTLTDARKTVKSDSGTLNYAYGKAMADPNKDIDRKIEDCLMQSPLTLTLDKFGTGSDVDGYELILKKVKAIVGPNVPDQVIAANLGSPTENVEYLFITYPEQAVKIGDTWKNDLPSIMQGVPIILSTTYTLADRRDGVAYLNFETAISVDKSQLPAEMAAEVDNIKFNAWIKGTGQVDEKTGFPFLMQVKQSMEVRDSYQGVDTHSKQSGTTTIKLIK